MKNIILILIIFVLFKTNIAGQNSEEIIILAENSYKTANYENAIYYYQRILCFGSEEEKNKCYIKIADCYFETENFDKSYSFYELAFNTIKSDSIKNEILFKKAILRLSEGRYNLALIELIDFDQNSSDYFSQKKEIYLGITYFLLNNFELSEKHILNYVEKSCPNKSDEIKKLFVENKKINKKLPKITAFMSGVIPGLGQLYLGDFKNAGNSAILNFSLIGIGVIVGKRYGIINAVFSVLPWFYRYYSGGIKGVKKTARQKINYKRQKIFDELLMLIIDN